MQVLVEAVSAEGTLLGSDSFLVPEESSLYLVDVLARLDDSDLPFGQIRAAKRGGSGILRGYLITANSDKTVTVSLGAAP